LEHVRGARVVLTSSTSVYGQTNGEWVDETSPTQPEGVSGTTVLKGEALLRAGDVAVRFGGIYGPGRTSFVDAVRNGTMTVNRRASGYTNRIHRDDAARILAHVLALPAPERIYNGVDSEPASRADIADWLARRLGVSVQETAEPEPPSFLRGNKRVRNARLLASGYEMLYPTFREGYASLLGTAISGGAPTAR
jgi:nucleoside-diphosphate-sugar epimerase